MPFLNILRLTKQKVAVSTKYYLCQESTGLGLKCRNLSGSIDLNIYAAEEKAVSKNA
jgi:hypothetical protein